MKLLLTDIGGVLLTNGWDTAGRKQTASHFGLDFKEMDDRHRLTYHIYEAGRMTLDAYLRGLVFYQPRSFTPQDFYAYMQTLSVPLPGMMEMYREMRSQHNLRIGAISNEGKDLGSYRVEKFALAEFIDFFVISGFFGMGKPDPAFFQIALDIGQIDLKNTLYIDDRQILVDFALNLGIPSYHHRILEDTKAAIQTFSVQNSAQICRI